MKTLLQKTHFLIFLILIFGLISCGKPPASDIVKDVSLNTSVIDGDSYLAVSALFKIGATSLPSITLPIINPKDKSIKYGEISFKPTLQAGYNEIGLKFNMTFSNKVQGGFADLPNGNDLPIGGLQNTTVIELGIDTGNPHVKSEIYLALDHDTMMMGFAIVIKEFDKVADAIPGANIFLGFDIKGAIGTVGLFTSPRSFESGLAFFVDLSGVVTPGMINDIIDGKRIVGQNMTAMSSGSVESLQSSVLSTKSRSLVQSRYRDQGVTRKSKKAVFNGVNALGRARLTIE